MLTIISAVQRLEPIANTCVAAMPELLLLGEKVFKDGFNTREGSESKGYTVCRFCGPSGLSADATLKSIKSSPKSGTTLSSLH